MSEEDLKTLAEMERIVDDLEWAAEMLCNNANDGSFIAQAEADAQKRLIEAFRREKSLATSSPE